MRKEKQQAANKRQMELMERDRKHAEWWESLTDEEKQKELQKQNNDREAINSVYDILNTLTPYLRINKNFKII